MPKASRSSRTPAPAATPSSVPPPSLPSIADLGHRIAVLRAEMDRQDLRSCIAKGADSIAAQYASIILSDQIAALSSLIRTMPAQTIADAAVLIATAVDMASGLSGLEHDADEASAGAGALERILLGVLPIVAEAAALDIDAMRWRYLDNLRASRFAGLECAQ